MAFVVRRRAILLALPALGLMGRCPSVVAQAKSKGIAVYPVAIPSYQQMFVAMEQGYFRDEGFDFKLIQGGSGVRAREIMAAGEGDFALEDILHCLQLTNRGRPARTVAAADTRSPSVYFLLRKDLYDSGIDTLQKFAAWKRPDGRKPIFGVSSIGGTAHLWANFFMERFGLADDVNWVATGNVDTMMGALRSKQIDMLSGPASIRTDAEARGWAKLIFLGSDEKIWNEHVGGSVPVNAHICLATTVQKDPEKVQAYVNGIYRAAQWIKAHSAEEILAVIEKYVGDTTREANLIEIEAVREVTDFNGIIDAAAFARGGKAWYRDLTGIKPVPLADVFADKFLRVAQAKYKA
jgi:NitT/TauT family transport system substrate-binding protein